MAKAPNPKTLGASKKANVAIRITVRGDTTVIRPSDFGARDDVLVRRETKAANVGRLSLLGAFQELDERSMGLDSICLLHWLGRRKAGDTTMSYAEALDRFPTYAEFEEHVTFEEITLDDEAEAGSPEA